jgi:D-alanine-D-alanine ligase
MTIDVFETMDCRSLARVDYLPREGVEPVVNEVNTFPGFTLTSQFSRIWEAAGLSRADLLHVLIDTALTRHAYRAPRLSS